MKVNIVFSKHKTLYSKLVTKFTKSSWSHVSIKVGDYVFDSDFGRGGVTFYKYEEFLKDVEELTMYEVELDRNKFIDIMAEELLKPYDLTAIFSFLFKRDWQENDKWFCSELVSYILTKCSDFKFKNSYNKITPEMLYQKIANNKEI